MSRKKVKNGYRLVFARDDKTKIVMNLNVQNQAILLLFYKLQSVWAYYLRYHLRVQLVLLRFFFCSTLITFGFNIM